MTLCVDPPVVKLNCSPSCICHCRAPATLHTDLVGTHFRIVSQWSKMLFRRLEAHLQKKEKQLLQKVREAEDNAAASSRELQRLERRAKDADNLSAELEACRRQMDSLSADCDLQAGRAASAIQRREVGPERTP